MADDKPQEAAAAEATKAAASEATDAKGAATSETAEVKKDEHGKPMMRIKVFAPFQVYFEGDAYSISAVNESGPFDILPHHHNFMCMLLPGDLLIQTPKQLETIKISRALMHVKAEKVTVYLDV